MKCIHFESCSAPLCPENQSSLDSAIWYPNEEICHKRNIPFVQNQKQLRHNKHLDFYFTYKLLERPMTDLNDPNMFGIDASPADRPEATRNWLVRSRGCIKSNQIA